ncbi:MAG: hypothetical protein K8T91_18490 [Planctomycetes bacterium]|nr:hypothetical protein [Planctomycetota bacterium]
MCTVWKLSEIEAASSRFTSRCVKVIIDVQLLNQDCDICLSPSRPGVFRAWSHPGVLA